MSITISDLRTYVRMHKHTLEGACDHFEQYRTYVRMHKHTLEGACDHFEFTKLVVQRQVFAANLPLPISAQCFGAAIPP